MSHNDELDRYQAEGALARAELDREAMSRRNPMTAIAAAVLMAALPYGETRPEIPVTPDIPRQMCADQDALTRAQEKRDRRKARRRREAAS